MDLKSPRMLKGSWTHTPDNKSLANVTRRLQLCQALCDEVTAFPLLSLVAFR